MAWVAGVGHAAEHAARETVRNAADRMHLERTLTAFSVGSPRGMRFLKFYAAPQREH